MGDTEKHRLRRLVTFNPEDIFHFIFFRNFKLLYDVKTIVDCHITHLKKVQQKESIATSWAVFPSTAAVCTDEHSTFDISGAAASTVWRSHTHSFLLSLEDDYDGNMSRHPSALVSQHSPSTLRQMLSTKE